MEENQEKMSRLSMLDDTLLIQARDELGETDEIREESILTIQEWIENEEKPYPLDDISILWFLRGCKYDIKRTQTRIENFFSFRSQVKEWYSDCDPLKPELTSLLDLGTFLPLPGTDDKGRKVILIRATIHNPYKDKQDDVFKIMNMVLDVLCREEEAISVTGVVAVVDLSGVGIGHAMQMTPSIIRKAVNSWQDVNPIRTKSMYYINTPLNVHVIMNIFKTFMKEKLRRRLHLHRGNGSKVFKTFVPSHNLPEEYGGTGPSIASLINEWKKKVLDSREWLLNEKRAPFARIQPNQIENCVN